MRASKMKNFIVAALAALVAAAPVANARDVHLAGLEAEVV
jgi:hypothetical protein